MILSIYSLWLNEGFARYMQNLGAAHIQETDTGILDRIGTKFTMTVMDKGWSKCNMTGSDQVSGLHIIMTEWPIKINKNQSLEIPEIQIF